MSKKQGKPSNFTNQFPEFKNFEIGDYTYGRPTIIITSKRNMPTIKIGKFCSIAAGVVFLCGGEHNPSFITTYPFNVMRTINSKKAKFQVEDYPKFKGDIIIGNDVWIGRDCFIKSGIIIGDGAVIGSKSVVAKNVQPYEIVAGNPIKHIRFRFSKDQIEKLLKIKWWNWSLEKINQNEKLMLSPNIDEFIDLHYIGETEEKLTTEENYGNR